MTKIFTIAVVATLLLFFSACDNGGTQNEIATTEPTTIQPATEPCELSLPLQPTEPPATVEISFADYWLAQLTVEEKIGQLIMPRLPWQTTEITPSLENWLAAVPFGGFILFTDNVQTIPQTQALIQGLQNQARLPLLMSVDEEGGRVARVGRIFDGGPSPAAFDIGLGGVSAHEVGILNASRLRTLGFNMNFAPVADIWSNPANAVIGTRAFGHTAEVVSPMVAATVQGLQNGGVFATLKHFPGHGDTYEDSHYQLAFHYHDIYRFWEKEALPFIAGIEAGVAAVMTGHISTPNVSGHQALLPWMQPWIDSGNLPATFSSFWLTDVLRGQMGFDGLIITDGLEMRALTDHFTCGQIALGAFLAGADILLIPATPVEAFEAMLAGYHEGLFTRERLNESVRRVLQAKEGL